MCSPEEYGWLTYVIPWQLAHQGQRATQSMISASTASRGRCPEEHQVDPPTGWNSFADGSWSGWGSARPCAYD